MKHESKAFRWWEDGGDSDHIAALLARLEIVSRRQVESMFAGAYRSAFLGRGMDFAEVRHYQPGDEIRWIDWNVSARMDDIYVKQFTEERERTVLLVWDASASMDLGSHWRSKRELGAELGMILAMSALANQDRVGLLVFGDRVERFLSPQRGRKQIMRMIREILTSKPGGTGGAQEPQTGPLASDFDDREELLEQSEWKGEPTHRTDFEAALRFLQRVAPRHSIIFLMSDFLAPMEVHAWQRLVRRCEVIPVVLRDPLETSLPLQKQPASGIFQALSTWVMGGSLLLFLLWGLGQGGAWLWSATSALSLWLLGSLYFASLGKTMIVYLQDLETDESFPVNLQRYQQADGEFCLPLTPPRDKIHQVFQTLALDVVELETNQDPGDALRSFFQQRQRVSGRTSRVSRSGAS